MARAYKKLLAGEWGRAIRMREYDQYLATDEGLIISIRYRKPRVLRPGKKPNGRLTVNLWANGKPKTEYVHRLVAPAFLGKPKAGQEVNHIDGNPQNNKSSNLEWCSRSHNQQHAFRTGLNSGRTGTNNFNNKLTEHAVREIRRNKGKITQQQLANKFGVSKSAIKHIQMRRVWKDLADDPSPTSEPTYDPPQNNK